MSQNIYNSELENVMDKLLSIIESKGIHSEEVSELSLQYPDYQENIENFCTTWSDLGDIEKVVPSADMDVSFYKMLSEQSSIINSGNTSSLSWNKLSIWLLRTVKDIRNWVILGALITAFAVGWYSKSESNNQEANELPNVENMSPMQFANFESASAFEKMERIQQTKEISDPNDVVLDMLRRRLIFDESVSVRLSALEVLMQFADHPKVREYLIESIPHQTEPIVIIELAELMNQLDEKDSANEWKQLLESDWMETDVKLQIEDKLETIL